MSSPSSRGFAHSAADNSRGAPQDVTDKDQHAEDHHQRIVLDIPCLNEPYGPTHGLDETADKSNQAVNDPSIPPTGSDGTLNCAKCRTVDDAINNRRIKLPEIDT